MSQKYYRRILDSVLQDYLDSSGAVLIEGAKYCGKTTTGEQHAASVLYMHEPAMREQNIAAAKLMPERLLAGPTPRLIDEWQLAPELWDAVRFTVDQRKAFGQFILTGSSTPNDQMKRYHSGTGRIARLTMRPMSLVESEDSSGEVSLKSLFEQPDKISGLNPQTIPDMAYLICRGGWPSSLDQKSSIALRKAFHYVDSIVESDLSLVDGIERDPVRVTALLRSYARHVGTQTPLTALVEDLKNNEAQAISKETVYDYVNALKRAFVIEDLNAWNPRLRSKTAVRTSDTHFFVDPSIGAAALRIGPEDLLNDLQTMGFFFEALCIRDLRVYTEALDGDIFHYRDYNNLECDAVLHLKNGRYALIEVKLGEAEFDIAADNLTTLKQKIDSEHMSEPSFMMILSGTRYAYRREDGIYVVPVGCLAP